MCKRYVLDGVNAGRVYSLNQNGHRGCPWFVSVDRDSCHYLLIHRTDENNQTIMAIKTLAGIKRVMQGLDDAAAENPTPSPGSCQKPYVDKFLARVESLKIDMEKALMAKGLSTGAVVSGPFLAAQQGIWSSN